MAITATTIAIVDNASLKLGATTITSTRHSLLHSTAGFQFPHYNPGDLRDEKHCSHAHSLYGNVSIVG